MSAYPKLSMKSPHITGFSINSACRFGHSASPDDFRVSLLVSVVLLPNLSPDSPGISFPVLHHTLSAASSFPIGPELLCRLPQFRIKTGKPVRQKKKTTRRCQADRDRNS